MKKIIYLFILVNIILFLCSCSTGNINTDNFKDMQTYNLNGLDLIAKLEDGSLLTISEVQEKKPVKNAIFIVDQDGNNKVKLIDSSDNKSIYTATFVANKWVVFAEATNDMISADWEIRALNIENNEMIRIDKGQVDQSVLKSPAVTFMAPLLSSSDLKVVWSTFEPQNDGSCMAVIRLYDLETRKSKLIDQTDKEKEEFGHPAIDGNYIVYDKGRIDKQKGYRWGTMYLKDLAANHSVTLDNARGVCSACIQYPYVAWDSGNKIKLYNIENENTSIISGDIISWMPSINKSYVSWLSNESAVYLYTLPSGPVSRIFKNETSIGGKLTGNLLSWPKKAEGVFITEYVDLSTGK